MGGSSSTPEHILEVPTTRWPPMTNMDNVLQRINKEFISVPENIDQRNNIILQELVTTFVTKMKTLDPLFNTLYNRIFYGGSYYDGLKVGAPDEYDLDLLMRFPKRMLYRLMECDLAGFLLVKIDNPELLGDQFKKKLLRDGNLSSDNLRRWMEGLVAKVLNTFPYENGSYELRAGGYLLRGRMVKSGPAMTLEVQNTYEKIKMHVDLVPCFEFDIDGLPGRQWRRNPCPRRNTFFIVPKRPKNLGDLPDVYWRLSFQEQERELINGKGNLKPALKLLKRLRDVSGHDLIASYYIKTVFLWINEREGPTCWNGRLSDVFLKMFKIYIEHLERGSIAYFWNEGLNLLTIHPETLKNMVNNLKRVLNKIERERATNPLVICEILDCKF